MSSHSRLSGRERLRRVFRCQPVDRMPMRLWGVDPMFRSQDPTWQPLYAWGERYGLDYIRHWSPVGRHMEEPPVPRATATRPSPRPAYWEQETVLETPEGALTQVFYQPKDGGPGYVMKHFIESAGDARRWLAIPPARLAVIPDTYFDLERRSGEQALLMVELEEAMYSVQALLGSELFGYWLMDERALLQEMIGRAYAGIEALLKDCLRLGLGDAYGWVGPELCIPPLASPADFQEFVVAYDKCLIDLIHDAGKLAWVHCHGDMHPVLEAFVAMGVDCLNPIEPPPSGKLTLADAKRRVNGRMCLEGGVQSGDFDLLEPEAMAQVVEAVIAQGKPGGGFILSSTGTPTAWAHLNERHLRNHRTFLETGARLAAYD